MTATETTPAEIRCVRPVYSRSEKGYVAEWLKVEHGNLGWLAMNGWLVYTATAANVVRVLEGVQIGTCGNRKWKPEARAAVADHLRETLAGLTS
jgi:hypothetical protein